MHVVFISNCEKRSITRTRSVLDRYATRVGASTWASLITQQALDEVRRALKRASSRHTSVACYRSDRVVGLRLIWIVGNRSSYDKSERFAIASKQKTKEMPMFWRHVALTAALGGYAHDLGKASKQFQNKLFSSLAKKNKDIAPVSDAIRHEWLSSWLLARMEKEESLGYETFRKLWMADEGESLKHLDKSGWKDSGLGKLASMAANKSLANGIDAAWWAICTHHGAMGGGIQSGPSESMHIRRKTQHEDNNNNITLWETEGSKVDAADTQRWSEVFARIAHHRERLQAVDRPSPYWEGVLWASRAALILADHRVSSETFAAGGSSNAANNKPAILYANTKPTPHADNDSAPTIRSKSSAKPPARYLDQPLSWHLLEVGSRAKSMVCAIAGADLPTLSPEIVRAVLSSGNEACARFGWQDRAARLAADLPGDKLIFNVASTGAGKTLGNLKIALAMRPKGARLAVAFNLRTLTVQTFAAFEKHVKGITDADFAGNFACLLGSKGGAKQEFSVEDEDDCKTEEDEDLVAKDGLIVPEWVKQAFDAKSGSSKNLAKLLAAPVLVSTVDWIIAAGEPGQQARHAKALIRVANSDLILDEVDSYDVKGSVAVMRLIQLAAMFGRNVIVSSATLNPALADGIIQAYRSGQSVRAQAFGEQKWSAAIVHDSPDLVFKDADPGNMDVAGIYRARMQEIARAIKSKPATKRYEIADIQNSTVEGFLDAISDSAERMHMQHGKHVEGLNASIRLSIGLVRVANVAPCAGVADHLASLEGRGGVQFVACAYHAVDIHQRRAERERMLDAVLDRKQPHDEWLQALRCAYPAIDKAEGDVCLIVVATPVEEVGRDHDFDWAVIEPSSMQSIIQTAGRVNRHRQDVIEKGKTNVAILDQNLRAIKGDRVCFTNPGLQFLGNSGIDTHRNQTRMTCLLRPLADDAKEPDVGDNVLDAGLVFDADGRKTLFAQCDEDAICGETKTAKDILARKPISNDAPAACDSYDMRFLLDDFVRRFPLRSSGKKICHVEIFDMHYDRARFRIAGGEGGHNKVFLSDCDGPEKGRTWLTPSLASLTVHAPSLDIFLSQYDGQNPQVLFIKWNVINVNGNNSPTRR